MSRAASTAPSELVPEPASGASPGLLPVAVLGAGSWGTALAIQFARAGHPTRLWGRDPAQRQQMERERCNARYLPDAAFPEALRVADTLDAALEGARDLLIAVPSHALRAMLTELRPRLAPRLRLAWATKGFELDTGLLPHQVARAVLGADVPIAVLSGPTFAREVGAGLPTAMVVASPDPEFATALATSLSSSNFRAYTSTDIVGVEVGGAVKNVMAVGAGLSDGLGFGANTRIALITRGLVEMTRLGSALGASRETFMGLAGLGDLVLTCTDDQSRNRRFGLALARGQDVATTLAAIGQVVEGHLAARAVHAVAARHSVSMPIVEGIHRTLFEGVPARDVVHELMTRPIKSEFD
ncbi:MAG: NAD(P)-dependent glycerol-3-phosphate dehydrogenase [Sinobacteraceae bacterium]|nr:NAD(P)-dependent glycerol-3-phosphate dehydrogenase [Nevskiaceae bacterium]MCP5338611.1 NAD(P)-dependent glycerol-3-phosphate dehydrogenase [Nevskiaceae bacterium]MCP5466710.1 NAD(P)-dependent glycerol-3-phosphate dehydrogenase [Nevskiaceae bacterium]